MPDWTNVLPLGDAQTADTDGPGAARMPLSDDMEVAI
jgi:hypothetical protein